VATRFRAGTLRYRYAYKIRFRLYYLKGGMQRAPAVAIPEGKMVDMFNVNPNYRACTAAVDDEPGRTRTVSIGLKSVEVGFLAPCTARKGLKGDA